MRLLESAVENTQDGILITEAKQLNQPGPELLYVNQAFTRITGYDLTEVLGRTPRLLQGPKNRPLSIRQDSDGAFPRETSAGRVA
jgi:PAS domain S-box-containing protein